MAITNSNRKILDLKRWEFCAPAPVASAAGACIASSMHYRQQQLYLVNNTTAYLYNPNEDGWIQISSPALAGTFGVGACAVASDWSTGATVGVASLTATAGTTSTITTNQTLARDLRGYSVHIMEGPNAGLTLPILSNTIGANAVITVATQGVAFSASTKYRLLTPRFYALGAGTLASGSFKVYDLATNTWTTLAHAGLAATNGTDGRLIATPSWDLTDYAPFATGTATAGGASTLTNGAKNWATNQWANAQVRITAGTGAGQIRTIASNTATALTVSAAWTTQPDATSQYAIEGNDDYLYFMGNNAVTLYRYSIAANTWSTLTPGAARAGAPGVGMSGHWIAAADDAAWQDENAIINGRRIYSLRGGAGGVLDYYDIAANTWVSNITYSPNTETFSTGSCYAASGRYLYIQKENTGRWFRLDLVTMQMDPWSTMLYAQSTAVVGYKSWNVKLVDGATELEWIYMLLNTSTVVLRQLVI